MGKNEKTGLGRALVKHHNHMIQQSKEKGRFFRNQHMKGLESVTDVSDIDSAIQNAEESDRFSDLDRFPVADSTVPIKLDMGSGTSDMTEEEKQKQRKIEEALHAGSLRVPRRPPWNSTMSVEELDENEHRSFLVWRRGLARLEENENLILTPFEKNLDIWRQLWRVVERSDLLVMVVDARDPLFYRCPDLEAYAREVDRYKRTLLLVNKADLLPISMREKWAEFFQDHGILFLFWSAKAATAALEGRKIASPWITQEKQWAAEDPHLKIYGREELLARLQAEAEEIVKLRRESRSGVADLLDARPTRGQTAFKIVTVGFVGYPNVGKSSTINALVGQKRTGVTSTPGKTKHFQTLIISEELTLCDCPGLVFPSFSSSRHEMIACGVLPIDRMTEHRGAIQVVANRVPRHIIEEVYNVKLPKPKPYEPQNRPPLASELLRTYCASRGYVGSSGLPDETRAARQILKDYIDGKLPHFELPPGRSSEENNAEDAVDNCLTEVHEGEKSDLETSGDSEREDESAPAPVLDQILNDMNSFDMENGLSSRNPSMKKPTASHKNHKKPQRKKDRSWRVGNADGDGMPVVRAFQKHVNRGPEVTG